MLLSLEESPALEELPSLDDESPLSLGGGVGSGLAVLPPALFVSWGLAVLLPAFVCWGFSSLVVWPWLGEAEGGAIAIKKSQHTGQFVV